MRKYLALGAVALLALSVTAVAMAVTNTYTVDRLHEPVKGGLHARSPSRSPSTSTTRSARSTTSGRTSSRSTRSASAASASTRRPPLVVRRRRSTTRAPRAARRARSSAPASSRTRPATARTRTTSRSAATRPVQVINEQKANAGNLYVAGSPEHDRPAHERARSSLPRRSRSRFVKRGASTALEFEVPQSLTAPAADARQRGRRVQSTIKRTTKRVKGKTRGFFEADRRLHRRQARHRGRRSRRSRARPRPRRTRPSARSSSSAEQLSEGRAVCPPFVVHYLTRVSPASASSSSRGRRGPRRRLRARPGLATTTTTTARPRPPRRRSRRRAETAPAAPDAPDDGARRPSKPAAAARRDDPHRGQRGRSASRKTLEFDSGDTIRLRFESDAADEVHIHGYDKYVQRSRRRQRAHALQGRPPRASSRSRSTTPASCSPSSKSSRDERLALTLAARSSRRSSRPTRSRTASSAARTCRSRAGCSAWAATAVLVVSFVGARRAVAASRGSSERHGARASLRVPLALEVLAGALGVAMLRRRRLGRASRARSRSTANLAPTSSTCLLERRPGPEPAVRRRLRARSTRGGRSGARRRGSAKRVARRPPARRRCRTRSGSATGRRRSAIFAFAWRRARSPVERDDPS